MLALMVVAWVVVMVVVLVLVVVVVVQIMIVVCHNITSCLLVEIYFLFSFQCDRKREVFRITTSSN